MAWTTPRTWTAGEELTAANLNTYVSDNLTDLDTRADDIDGRTVKTFADASARTSGITSPTEGMLSYLADTDAVEVYDGSAWVSVAPTPTPPAILQVVTVRKTDVFSTTSTSAVDVTGLTASITPSGTASKIIVQASVPYAYADGGGGAANTGYLLLSRGTTNLTNATSPGSRVTALLGEASNTGDGDMLSFSYSLVDAPATTSSTQYRVRAIVQSGTMFVNRSRSDADNNSKPRGVATLTLYEVA